MGDRDQTLTFDFSFDLSESGCHAGWPCSGQQEGFPGLGEHLWGWRTSLRGWEARQEASSH